MATLIVLYITWLGQACFHIQAGDTKILIDPAPANMLQHQEPLPADLVLITHEHRDHNNVSLASGNPVVLRGLKNEGKEWNEVQFENKDVKITGIPVYHDAEQGAKRGKNMMFLIETQGLRLLHTGDLGHDLSEETIQKIGHIDILMICVGGYYTIDAAQARKIADQLKPTLIFPMHYKTAATASLPISDAGEFLKDWKAVLRMPANTFDVAKDMPSAPSEGPTIAVLPFQPETAAAPTGEDAKP